MSASDDILCHLRLQPINYQTLSLHVICGVFVITNEHKNTGHCSLIDTFGNVSEKSPKKGWENVIHQRAKNLRKITYCTINKSLCGPVIPVCIK